MITRVALFFSSYALLFVLLAIRFNEPAFVAACLVLAALAAATAAWLLHVQTGKGRERHTLTEVTESGGDVAGYLLSYVLAFLVTSADPRTIAQLALVFAVVGLIYVRSSMIQLNPTFYLLGYRVVSFKGDQDESGFLITRRTLVATDEIEAVDMGGRVYKQTA